MNPELLAALTAVLIKAGLKEDSQEFKAITAEPFKGVSDKLEIKLPTTLDEALKLPSFQSEFDRKVTLSNQAREDNLKAKWDFVEKGTAPKEETPLEKEVREMREANTKRDSKDILDGKKASAKKLLEDKKIPQSFLKQFDFDSETSIEDQLEGVETIYTEVKQGIVSESVGNSKFPTGGDDKDVSDEEAKDLVDSIY